MNLNRSVFTPKSLSYLGMAALLTFSACDDETPAPETEALPLTYNFENVDYSGQQQRIQMLSMLESKAKSANDGTKVTFDELNAIFINETNILETDKNIKSKTESSAIPEIEAYFNTIDARSGSTDNIFDGRLYDEKGVEPAQMIAKGLMGALLYYQATSVYLGDDKMNVDNEKVTEGKGTAMEHHWDEAFGYFGAPDDYLTAEVPAETTDPSEKVWYWAGYANKRKEVVDVRDEIFNAFIAGRAAIGRGDMEARNAAIATIKENWELLVAANAVHYINSALENLENNAEGDFYHHMSEGKAFLNALRYNLDKSVSVAQIDELDALFGENFKASYTNKEATKEALNQALVKLKEAFEFTDAQMLNL